jgi:hypothetical protein
MEKSVTIKTNDTPPKWYVVLHYHPQGYQAVFQTIEFDDQMAAEAAAKKLEHELSFTSCTVVPKGTVIL